MSIQGESLPIDERLVVAPSWGRIRRGDMTDGQVLGRGDVIADLIEGGTSQGLTTHLPSLFVSWLVQEGERVGPGAPIAVLRTLEDRTDRDPSA